MKAKKPAPIMPWMARTRARRSGGKLVPNHATAAPNNVSISTHSTIEPSWFDQTPVIL